MKKTTMILVVSAIFGALLVGCSPAAEGNNTPDAAAPSKTGKAPTSTGTATADAPVNAPATK